MSGTDNGCGCVRVLYKNAVQLRVCGVLTMVPIMGALPPVAPSLSMQLFIALFNAVIASIMTNRSTTMQKCCATGRPAGQCKWHCFLSVEWFHV